MIPWVTVETLAPHTMSVASVGDQPRDFTNWERVLQRQMTKIPALFDNLSTRGVAEAIRAARERCEDVDIAIPTNSGPHQLKIRLVLGPADDAHAVRIWLGPTAAPVPLLRPALGAIWDLGTQTLRQSQDAAIPGLPAGEHIPTFSITEIFHRMPSFTRHAELLELLYEPRPGQRLQCEAAVTTSPGATSRWRITARASDDAQPRTVRWLIEDVPDAAAPPDVSALECIGLREAHRRAGTHLALVQLGRAAIAHWLTDPAPWVRWDYLFRPVDVFHPDDRVRLVELATRFRAGDSVGLTVRVLNHGGGYTPTLLLLYPYPGQTNRHLAIAQWVRAPEQSPLLDPEHLWAELDRRGAPIGYDDVVRDWLTGRSAAS
ncbi:GAF domain-containing protein [Nocardia sp. NPDC051832]|uniref:GAF domain-containing protein n=1 Tax=Nocardia sp. NPDC051832 TaxID=3155673 RepID=UPI0034289D92